MNAYSQVYCFDELAEHSLGIYMSGCGQPCDPSESQMTEDEESDEYEDETQYMTTMPDKVVARVAQRLKSWATQAAGRRSLHVEAIDELGSEWYTRICQQLDDRSVHVDTLTLNCNTELDLCLILDKIAACNTVTLTLDTYDEALALVDDNADMLKRLTQSLSKLRTGNIQLGICDNEEVREEQLQILREYCSNSQQAMPPE